MNAVELKFADGKGTGLWYCSRCRNIADNATAGSHPVFKYGLPSAEFNHEWAERCCTGQKTCLRCTGCRKDLSQCVCGRAGKNLCAGCQSKLFFGEGQLLDFGASKREFCNQCAKTLQAKLVDGRK